MPSTWRESPEWLDSAEQAGVAEQLNDPGARKAVLELARASIASPDRLVADCGPKKGIAQKGLLNTRSDIRIKPEQICRIVPGLQ